MAGTYEAMLDVDGGEQGTENVTLEYVERTSGEKVAVSVKRYTCVKETHKKHVLHSPIMQLKCGHRICKSCITEIVHGGTYFRCPGQKQSCLNIDLTNTKHRFHDAAAERELKERQIYCPNRTEGCMDKIAWINTETHLQSCPFKSVPCENSVKGCTEQFNSDEDLQKHQNVCKFQMKMRTTTELMCSNTANVGRHTSQRFCNGNTDRKVLLVGQTGSGKSSTANTLFGEQWFTVNGKSPSVYTPAMERRGRVLESWLTITDTPGITDYTDANCNQILQEIAHTASSSRDGFHAICLVIRYPTRLTAEERKLTSILQSVLGPDFWKYLFVVVTGGDTYNNEMEKTNRPICFAEFVESSKTSRNSDTLGMLARNNIDWILFNNFEKDEHAKIRQQQHFLQSVEHVHNSMKKSYKSMMNHQIPRSMPTKHTNQGINNNTAYICPQWSWINLVPNLWNNLVLNIHIINMNGYTLLLNGIPTTIYGHGIQLIGAKENSFSCNAQSI